jgi:hypothetical protein
VLACIAGANAALSALVAALLIRRLTTSDSSAPFR